MILLLTLLFYTFLCIGLFGFGGGYAMLSMIQGEVVEGHHWLTVGQFTDIVAISQMTPGPIGINSATYVGFTSMVNAGYPTWAGVLGSCVATFAVVLPSFVLMLIISKFLMRYWDHPIVESIFQGIRPATVGLLLAASLLLMNKENFGSLSTDWYQHFVSILLFLYAFIAQRIYKVSPILIIVVAGMVGYVLL